MYRSPDKLAKLLSEDIRINNGFLYEPIVNEYELEQYSDCSVLFEHLQNLQVLVIEDSNRRAKYKTWFWMMLGLSFLDTLLGPMLPSSYHATRPAYHAGVKAGIEQMKERAVVALVQQGIPKDTAVRAVDLYAQAPEAADHAKEVIRALEIMNKEGISQKTAGEVGSLNHEALKRTQEGVAAIQELERSLNGGGDDKIQKTNGDTQPNR